MEKEIDIEQLKDYLRAKSYTRAKTKGKGITYDFLLNLLESGSMKAKDVYSYGSLIVRNARLLMFKDKLPYTVLETTSGDFYITYRKRKERGDCLST